MAKDYIFQQLLESLTIMAALSFSVLLYLVLYLLCEGGKTFKAMFVCKVAAGKSFKTKKGDTTEFTHLGIPPREHDSVVGEPGVDLNYDELVVYKNEAALPCYLMVYTV